MTTTPGQKFARDYARHLRQHGSDDGLAYLEQLAGDFYRRTRAEECERILRHGQQMRIRADTSLVEFLTEVRNQRPV